MGYPTTGELAKFNSVTGSTDLSQLLVTAVKNLRMTFNETAPVEDVSGDGDTATKMVAGLYESSLEFEGVYPKSSPRFGNSGLVTFGSGYAQFVESWSMEFDFGELDITAFAGTAPTTRVYRPAGRPIVRGTYTARLVSDAAFANVSAVNSTGAAATFKLSEDGTDPGFSGSILASRVAVSAGGNGLQTAAYSFEFADAVTSIAGSTLPALLPSGTVDVSDWDTNGDGTPDVAIVWQTAASRTVTANGYLRSLRVECNVGDVIRVSGTIRNSSAVTLA